MDAFAQQLPAWTAGLHLPLLGRLLLALACGAAIGLERELNGKPAGLRTNILICVGAALFMELSIVVSHDFAGHDLVRADPARIAAQVVSALGFVGAGTILVARGNIVGLTTATTMWVVASLGMAIGAQMYVEAIGGTVLVVLTLFALGKFEARVLRERSEFTVRVGITGRQGAAPAEAVFESHEFEARRLGHEYDGDRATYTYRLKGPGQERDPLLRALADTEGVATAAVE